MTNFEYRIKSVEVSPDPMSGRKRYQSIVLIGNDDIGFTTQRTGVHFNRNAVQDDISTIVAKIKSSQENKPITVPVNYNSEKVTVNANSSYAAEIEKDILENNLRELTEDPSNPGYSVSGKRLVDADEYMSADSLGRKNIAAKNPEKLEDIKNRFSEINQQLREERPSASIGESTPSTSAGTPQPGTTRTTPQPGPDEDIGGTGVLETTQTTPGVTTDGTVTDYTPLPPSGVDPTTGVSTVTTQTGNLSALPPSVTYATNTTGTPGNIPESLLAPSISGQGASTYDNWMASQNQRAEEAASGIQGGYTVILPNGKTANISYGQPIPPGSQIVKYYQGEAPNIPNEESPVNAYQGGMMTSGYAPGGLVDNAIVKIAQMNGFQGNRPQEARMFMNSSEGLRAKARAIGAMMNEGGLMRSGYNPGGVVTQNDNGQWIIQFPDGTASVYSTGDIGKQQAEADLASLPADTVTMDDGSDFFDTVDPPDPAGTTPTSNPMLDQFKKQQQDLISGTMSPIGSDVAKIQPQAEDFIPTDAGQTAPISPFAEAATVGTTAQAGMPTETPATTMTPTTISSQVQGETGALDAETGSIRPGSVITPEQQLTSAVTGMEGATGESVDVYGAPIRTMQEGEQIAAGNLGLSSVDFDRVGTAFGTGEVQAASMQDELAGLMAQFEGGNTPAWAAGAMRRATAEMAARGLGSSSMAGQAIIQAAMEAALPIAQIDTGNKQQVALFKAEQRAKFMQMDFDQDFQAKVINSAKVSEIANMNFNAQQQIAIENSRAANTMELANLSNSQAMIMAEAAALANLDMANLNNRQQAAVQNAQNFLQMDMTNLSNEQATAIFKAQQNIQALFSDQAAENAAAQFNASSENQNTQFFASLSNQTAQFNASQQNAMDQFNVNSINALREFNSNLQQQRDLFNAQNGLVVAQANAQWRQNIATLNTAAQNESNMNFAKTINALTATNLDQIWQRERDIMSFAFTAQQSALDRSLNLLLGDKKIEQVEKELSERKDIAATDLAFRFFFGSDPSGLFGGIFNNNKEGN